MQFTSQLEQGDWYIVASWLCVVLALLLYGIGIALGKVRQAVGRARAKRKPAHALAALRKQHPRGTPPPRRETIAPPEGVSAPIVHTHWCAVAAIVEAGLAGVETAAAFHTTAGRQIDAAEYALNRLIADLVKVMPRAQPMPAEAARPIRRTRPTRVAEALAA